MRPSNLQSNLIEDDSDDGSEDIPELRPIQAVRQSFLGQVSFRFTNFISSIFKLTLSITIQFSNYLFRYEQLGMFLAWNGAS